MLHILLIYFVEVSVIFLILWFSILTSGIRARLAFVVLYMEAGGSSMIKLNNSNWVTWKPRTEDILFCKDLHEPIEGAAAKLENVSDAYWRK